MAERGIAAGYVPTSLPAWTSAAAAAEGGGSQGPTSADGEVRIGLNDIILGNGPGAPQYGRVFSQAASLRFYTQY